MRYIGIISVRYCINTKDKQSAEDLIWDKFLDDLDKYKVEIFDVIIEKAKEVK